MALIIHRAPATVEGKRTEEVRRIGRLEEVGDTTQEFWKLVNPFPGGLHHRRLELRMIVVANLYLAESGFCAGHWI